MIDSTIDGSDADGPGGAIFTLDGDVAIFGSTLHREPRGRPWRRDLRRGGRAGRQLHHRPQPRGRPRRRRRLGARRPDGRQLDGHRQLRRGPGWRPAGGRGRQPVRLAPSAATSRRSAANLGVRRHASTSFGSIVGPAGHPRPERRHPPDPPQLPGVRRRIAGATTSPPTTRAGSPRRATCSTRTDRCWLARGRPRRTGDVPAGRQPGPGPDPHRECAATAPDPMPAGQLLTDVDWPDVLARDQLGELRDNGVPCDDRCGPGGCAAMSRATGSSLALASLVLAGLPSGRCRGGGHRCPERTLLCATAPAQPHARAHAACSTTSTTGWTGWRRVIRGLRSGRGPDVPLVGVRPPVADRSDRATPSTAGGSTTTSATGPAWTPVRRWYGARRRAVPTCCSSASAASAAA